MFKAQIKKLIPLIFMTAISGCATHKASFYQDGYKPDNEIAIYSLFHGNTFWSDLSIYTLEVDAQSSKDMVQMKISGEAFGDIALTPGKHTFRLSFIDYDNLILPSYLSENKFQGWYEVEANLQPGRFYSAHFKQVDGKTSLVEMCLVEVEQNNGIVKARSSQNYVACGKSSIPAVADNIKPCTQYHPDINQGRITSTKHEEYCGN